MLVSIRKIPVKRKKTAPNSILIKTTCKQSQTKHLTAMIAQSIDVHSPFSSASSASSSVSLLCSELSSEDSLGCKLLFLVVSLFLNSSSLDLVSDIEKDIWGLPLNFLNISLL